MVGFSSSGRLTRAQAKSNRYARVNRSRLCSRSCAVRVQTRALEGVGVVAGNSLATFRPTSPEVVFAVVFAVWFSSSIVREVIFMGGFGG